jgi:GLPGLI family protein
MIKPLVIFISIIVFCTSAHAQRYKVKYESFPNDENRLKLAEQLSGKDAEGLIALQYIHQGSELLYDNGLSSWYYNGEDTYPEDCEITKVWFNRSTSVVYKDHSKNETTFMNQLYKGVCKVHTLRQPELFEITGETKMINGYLTQRAVLKENRLIDAWFTPLIDIQDGPFNIGGLPGLVLEFNDKGMTYRMLKVEEVPEGVEMILPLPECNRKLTPDDYNQHRRKGRGE